MVPFRDKLIITACVVAGGLASLAAALLLSFVAATALRHFGSDPRLALGISMSGPTLALMGMIFGGYKAMDRLGHFKD